MISPPGYDSNPGDQTSQHHLSLMNENFGLGALPKNIWGRSSFSISIQLLVSLDTPCLQELSPDLHHCIGVVHAQAVYTSVVGITPVALDPELYDVECCSQGPAKTKENTRKKKGEPSFPSKHFVYIAYIYIHNTHTYIVFIYRSIIYRALLLMNMVV